jgi:hypothetical protein
MKIDAKIAYLLALEMKASCNWKTGFRTRQVNSFSLRQVGPVPYFYTSDWITQSLAFPVVLPIIIITAVF